MKKKVSEHHSVHCSRKQTLLSKQRGKQSFRPYNLSSTLRTLGKRNKKMGEDSYPTSEGYNQTLEPVMGANETMASTVAPIVDAELTGGGGGLPATESPAATTAAAAAAAAAANEESVLKTSANVDIFDYLVIPSIYLCFFKEREIVRFRFRSWCLQPPGLSSTCAVW